MAAVDMLFVNDPWIASKSDSIHKTKSQLRDIEYLLGNYNSSIFVDRAALSNRFVHVTYLALFDRKPARIEFQFYRAKEKWKIHSLTFDTDVDEELKLGARTKIAKFRARTN